MRSRECSSGPAMDERPVEHRLRGGCRSVTASAEEFEDALDLWRGRPLDHDVFDQVFLDLTRLRVDSAGPASRGGVVTAMGVTPDGNLEVLGVDVGDTENEAFWWAFLDDLRRRGLHGVAKIVCEHHDGLGAAVSEVFPEATYQAVSVDDL